MTRSTSLKNIKYLAGLFFALGFIEFSRRGYKKLFKKDYLKVHNQVYQDWIEKYEKIYILSQKKVCSSKLENYENKPLISILMPVYNTDVVVLQKSINSIKSQWYQNWELIIVDDNSDSTQLKEYLNSFEYSKEKDKRIKIFFNKKNENISATTNTAFKHSTGEYLLLMDHDDYLHEHALYEFVEVINDSGDQDIIYFDEDKIDLDDNRFDPYFKPDFSPELLYSHNYITHAFYSRRLFSRLKGLRIGYEGSQDYDLVLRACEVTDKIIHIPQILYSWRTVAGSTSAGEENKESVRNNSKRAIEKALKRRNLLGRVEGEVAPYHVSLKPKKNSKVEIIIPIKDKVELLKDLLRSIEKNNTYENLEITVVDNNSDEEETTKYLEEISDSVKILEYKKPYNFSAINNFAVKDSDSDYLLFLNNDIKVLSQGFVERMLGFAEQEGIGAVGNKLIFEDDSIQHAGVVMGYAGVANHAFRNMDKDTQFYFSHVNAIKNYLVVTGASLMISRKKFNEVGMFDEDLPNSFNDVDLCLKLFEKGYRNVYLPNVVMYHYESKTRNPQIDPNVDMLIRKRWKKYIDYDPYYNKNLNKNGSSGPIFSIKQL